MSGDMLELLILIALAGVVLYRLKSVIGTRTGHEGPPDFVRRQQEAAEAAQGPVAVPDPEPYEDDTPPPVPENSRDALAQIHQIEPGFDTREFAQGARVSVLVKGASPDKPDSPGSAPARPDTKAQVAITRNVCRFLQCTASLSNQELSSGSVSSRPIFLPSTALRVAA